jgi:hypothetical protein
MINAKSAVRILIVFHRELDFYSASSLKQQSEYRHVAPLGHIMPNRANKSLLFLLNGACLANPRYTGHEASTLTITPLMWFINASQKTE